MTVTDTIHNADSSLASCKLEIIWPAMITPDNVTITAGRLTTATSTAGVITVSLAPNIGSTPTGTSYQVNFRCTAATYTERWVIPATGPRTIAEVRVSPVPVPLVILGQHQLFPGSGFQFLISNLLRASDPTATQEGQCYWNTVSHTMRCSDNTLAFNPFSGSGAAWGSITGTLSSQTDLNSALSGKASSTHAPQHQNGGADEVATATAGANAIPKAGSGGTLAAGWLPLPTASTIGAIKSLTCSGTDKLSAIGTDGLPVCSADQGGAGAVSSVDGRTGAVVDVFDNLAANTMTNVAAPATPAAGKTAVWTDATDKTVKAKDDAGVVTTTVKPDSGAASNFVTAISAAGVISKAQPSAANLSDGTTGSGAVVLATSPILTTPNIGSATGSITGNAGTATALAADPADCTGNNFALGIAASGAASCAQPAFSNLSGSVAASQMPALSGDVTTSAGSVTTTLANIPDLVPQAGSILATNIAAPASPAAGKVKLFTDSTDLRFHDKNASGVIGTTVVADTGAANNFLTAISAAGAISKAQPSCSSLSNAGGGCSMSTTAGGDLSGTLPSPSVANLPDGVTQAGHLLATNIAAPASPASGKVKLFADSTDLRFHDKNASGTIGTTVVADAGAANNFLTAISAAGVISKAQPAFTNLSGSIASGQQNAPSVGGKGGVEAKTCSGTDKISAIGTDGIPVCSADEGGAGAVSSVDGRTGAVVDVFDNLAANTLTNVSAPATPAAGKTAVWTDATDKSLKAKDDAGVITTTVKPDTGASNNFLTAVSAAGVISKARPACADLSDSASGCSTAAVSLVGSGTAGSGPAYVGDASTAARSNHDHRSISTMTWYFPGIVAAGVQNARALAPEAMTNGILIDARITVGTTSASSSTWNIERCTTSAGNCTATANIYSSAVTLNANTQSVAGGTPNTTTIAAGDAFRVNLVSVGASLADVTVTLTYKANTTN